mgnify:FL=1
MANGSEGESGAPPEGTQGGGDLIQPVGPGERVDLVERLTAEEVRLDERPRRAFTPSPAPAANGAPRTTKALMEFVTRKIEEGIRAAMAPFRKQIADIAAVNEARAEELATLRSRIEQCVTADALTKVQGEIGTVRGRVEGFEVAQRSAEETDRRLENRLAD